MSVLAAKRNESRYESIVFAIKLQGLLIEFAQRNYGLRDFKSFVRRKYAGNDSGLTEAEVFSKYNYLLINAKKNIDMTSNLLVNNLVSARSIYPTNLTEFTQKRGHLNAALGNCNQLTQGLQHIVDIFDVDVNGFKNYQRSIDREIELIKKWRQRENQIKSQLKG